MKEFLLILFFGKSILLTPDPVDLSNQWLELVPPYTFEAVTSGASLGIQISTEEPFLDSVRGSGDVLKRLQDMFPKGTLEAKLIDTRGDETLLSKHYFSISDFSLSSEGSLIIALVNDKPIPTDVKFKKIMLRSKVNLSKVRIIWKNYKH